MATETHLIFLPAFFPSSAREAIKPFATFPVILTTPIFSSLTGPEGKGGGRGEGEQGKSFLNSQTLTTKHEQQQGGNEGELFFHHVLPCDGGKPL